MPSAASRQRALTLVRTWPAPAGLCLVLAAATLTPASGQGTAGSTTATGSVVARDSTSDISITSQQDPAVLAEMAKAFAGQLAASAEARALAERRTGLCRRRRARLGTGPAPEPHDAGDGIVAPVTLAPLCAGAGEPPAWPF